MPHGRKPALRHEIPARAEPCSHRGGSFLATVSWTTRCRPFPRASLPEDTLQEGSVGGKTAETAHTLQQAPSKHLL